MKKLSIIIPLYNEEKTVGSVLDEIVKVWEDLKKNNIWIEVIISNDGSTDNSVKKVNDFIVNKDNFILIDNKINHWKWFAVKEGVKKSTWDYIIIQDADLEYNPSDYLSLIKEFESKKLDFLYWSRILWIKKYKNTYSTFSFLLWWLLVSMITSILTFKKITDEPTCYKLFKWDLKKLLVCPNENGFEWEPAVTMLLFRKWYKYGEYPIHYKARKPEEWKKIKFSDWFKAIYTLFKWKFKKIYCNNDLKK